jgi:hypothetical protein
VTFVSGATRRASKSLLSKITTTLEPILNVPIFSPRFTFIEGEWSKALIPPLLHGALFVSKRVYESAMRPTFVAPTITTATNP